MESAFLFPVLWSGDLIKVKLITHVTLPHQVFGSIDLEGSPGNDILKVLPILLLLEPH